MNRRAINAKNRSRINTTFDCWREAIRKKKLAKATAKRYHKKAEMHRQQAEWFLEKGRHAMTLDPTTEEGKKALKDSFDAMVDKIREISSCPEEFNDMVNEILWDHKYGMIMEREALQRLEDASKEQDPDKLFSLGLADALEKEFLPKER